MIQPAPYKCFPLITAIPPGFLIPAYFIRSEFIVTSRAMMKMFYSTKFKILNLKFILILLPWLLQSTGNMTSFCFALCPADKLVWTLFPVLQPSCVTHFPQQMGVTQVQRSSTAPDLNAIHKETLSEKTI